MEAHNGMGKMTVSYDVSRRGSSPDDIPDLTEFRTSLLQRLTKAGWKLTGVTTMKEDAGLRIHMWMVK